MGQDAYDESKASAQYQKRRLAETEEAAPALEEYVQQLRDSVERALEELADIRASCSATEARVASDSSRAAAEVELARASLAEAGAACEAASVEGPPAQLRLSASRCELAP